MCLWRVAQWHVNQPRKQVDTPGQSDLRSAGLPPPFRATVLATLYSRHTNISRQGVDMMRHIAIETAGRWDLALACASLSLVMLVLTGVLHSQHHKTRAAPVLVSDVLP